MMGGFSETGRIKLRMHVNNIGSDGDMHSEGNSQTKTGCQNAVLAEP